MINFTSPWRARPVFILFLVVCAALFGMAAAGAQGPDQALPDNGQAAIDSLGADLADVAAAYGMTAEQLSDLFLQDHTLYVGNSGELFHVDDPFLGDALASQADLESSEVPPFPVGDTFLLHSRPGATHKIYLDFDGHTTIGTTWNSSYGIATIVSPPYDIDGNPGSFSITEIERIQVTWQIVAEDFSPFDIDITTEDPGAAALSYQGAGDDEYGVRVVITDDTFANCGCGGHAFIGAFDDSEDEPAFVYNQSLVGVSEASTHEVGHTILLSHDGTSAVTYYQGHGSGATSWAPIMGVGYYVSVVQWDKGEYYDANNVGPGANYGNGADDLAIIASPSNGNGFGYRPDDHGDSQGTATPLAVAGTAVSGAGVIEQTSDVDVFSFSTGAGLVTLNLDPAVPSPNLDILAELRDSGGTLIATSNPAAQLNASFSETLAAGTYYVSVDGTGVGTPGSNPPTGYTDYGSLGQYTIAGTVTGGGAPPDINVIPPSLSVVVPLNGSTTELLTIENLGGGPLTYSISDEETGSPAPSIGARPDINDGPDKPSTDTMEASPLAALANGGEAAALVNPVLIIQDSLPWGWDAIQATLSANGIAYDQVDSTQIATINLAPYQMVVIPSTQGDPYVTLFNANIAKFEAYVNAGGKLWLSTVTQPGGIDLLTPGGVVSTLDLQEFNDIVAPGHPWVSGVPNPMAGSWASHNSFTNLYPGSTVVAQAQATGNPTLMDYSYGVGRVLLTGQTLEITWGLGWDGAPIVENSLLDLFYTTSSVLIIQDSLPWGHDSIQQILSSHGIGYDQVDSSQIVSVNLAPYQMVIIPSVQGAAFYTTWNANIAKFEAYVNGGGKLWQSTCNYSGTAVEPLTVGGVTSATDLDNFNDVVAAGHPWVLGVPNPMEGNFASHDSYTNLYTGSTVVAQAQTTGNPTLVDYSYGAGRVLITGQTLEYAWGSGWDGAPIVENSLLNMLGANPDALWLTESPTSGSVPAGGWQDITVNFDATGLSAGTYTGNILIASDDPDEPLVAVPVSMAVTVPTALLYIDPPYAVVPLGDTTTVDVFVDDSSSSTFATEIELSFDPNIVEVVQVLPGTCPVPDFVAQNVFDNVNGTLNYAATSLAPTSPCSNGTVIQITFRGLLLDPAR